MPKANAKNTNSRQTKHAKAVGAAKTDPIYAAIDRHVAAYAKYDAAITVTGRLEGRRGKHKPGFAAAMRKQNHLMNAEWDAHKAIRTNHAKTTEGAAAAARYLRARCIDDNGGRGYCDNELKALDAFVCMTTALAPRAHSTDFLKVKAIIKRIAGERAKRHARAVKWLKKQDAKEREKKKKESKKPVRKLSAAEIRGQREAFGLMRRIIVSLEPDQPKAKTKKLAKAA